MSLSSDQTNSLFLNEQPCIVRPTLFDMNLNELKYDLFIINLNKRTVSCNVYLQTYVFQKKQKTYMLKYLIS